MSSAAESKEPEAGDMDVIGGLFECKPGQKYPTPSPGNGGKFLLPCSLFWNLRLHVQLLLSIYSIRSCVL